MKVLLTLIFVLSCNSYSDEDFSGNLMIKVKKKGIFYFCSAVAVKPKILLTAAHCLDTAQEVLVFKGEEKLPLENFEMHPKYQRKNSLYNFDIGVINLKNSLSGDVAIYSIANTKGSEPIIRVGFGGRSGHNKMTVLRGLKSVDHGNRFIKAIDNGSVSGDSGGALFQKNGKTLNLIAIHSTIDGGFSFNPSLSLADSWLKSKLEK